MIRFAIVLVLCAGAEGLAGSPLVFERLRISDVTYEAVGAADLNQDGRLDIVSGEYWFEGPTFERRHKITSVQRVDDYYASASHILDQASFEDRSSTDEQAVRDAEQHGAAGLKRIAAINGQLLHLNRLLDDLDEQNATDAPNLAALRL